MALHVDARGGVMLLTAAPYDDEIITHIRSLPERRYRRQTRDWCIPARGAHLRADCAGIGELEVDQALRQVGGAVAERHLTFLV
jgi:hypothetical protein